MISKNPSGHWGGVSQSLHWLIVALIVWMAWLGLTMTDLPNTPRKVEIFALHKSIGLTILALIVLRLAWRAYAGAPDALQTIPRWQRRLAGVTHAGMYLLLLAMPISGWVIHSASGFPLRWFGWFRVPPITGQDEALQELAATWHEWIFWTLVVMVVLHAGAAVWHHLFQQDETLLRMLPRRRARAPAANPSFEDSNDA